MLKILKILIADDHTIVRKGLVQILADSPDPIMVDEAYDGEEALAKALASDYDLVLLDISMPGKGGLDVLKELKDRSPKLPVLILSMHPEEQYAVRALRSGASGYLTKGSAADELLSAIRKVLSGGKYVSSSLAEKLAGSLDEKAERPLHETLSIREFQVLCMIGSGKTTTEIAAEISLSVKTISTFRARILHKMRMKNNAELTCYAIHNKLVD
ncbi:MAG TPA: response regulator transcription factor [Dongiaceae bacterium]|nr:response regulator transcription factor [Dongiaceae bacterium]